MFQTADPLLMLAVVLVAGMSFGTLARRIGLPGITGQIIAGVVLGQLTHRLFAENAIDGLQPLTHFALALMGVTVGAHLNVTRLRNARKRLLFLLAAEATITPLIVASVMYATGELSPTIVALLATLAISTAPATVVALVRESRSTGVFVKTLVAAVAINNMTCIFLFEVARGAGRTLILGDIAGASPGNEVMLAFWDATLKLLAAALLGGGAAALTQIATYRMFVPERLASVSAISILLTFGLASHFALSPLLACMALGAAQTNLNPARDRLAGSVFENFEPMILCVFFTLAGIHLSLDHAAKAGLLALLFVGARIAGKLLSATLAMKLAGATSRVRRNLGIALTPQAGVAIGLVILIQEDAAFAGSRDLFVAIVLLGVTINEIIGPILTRSALTRSGEAGMDRPRLVDFLREENIVTGFHAESKEDAIEQLVGLLISSHHIEGTSREELLDSVLEREAQVSTCLGGGVAVPHGEIAEGSGMVGVMAISREGLAFETPDGQPVHCMVLLATPLGERDRHLEVLAALARTLGADPSMQAQLYQATSAAHAYEILHGDATEDFNYFLEDHTQPGARP